MQYHFNSEEDYDSDEAKMQVHSNYGPIEDFNQRYPSRELSHGGVVPERDVMSDSDEKNLIVIQPHDAIIQAGFDTLRAQSNAWNAKETLSRIARNQQQMDSIERVYNNYIAEKYDAR